ncbi:LacI family DNA-binding transcriptional regulator [Microbacterium sp. NPDC057407]|uniref:LacI family DNA-binding transcriptional regulator n=1 Tax=Microbacterium sp. NPDC057407 TaxID=3346120 RepID=UPI00366DA88D
MERRVSMADVAAAAGVSGQTVSRVVNDSPRVDPATRARVERAMTELGYRPHRAARALRTGRTHTIGLLASTLATVGNSRMLQALADAAATRGYALTVVTLGAEPDVAAAFERLSEQGVDGTVVLNEATAAVRDASLDRGARLVVVDSPPDDRFAIVQTAHASGARAAVEHLLALGHETVHHVGGPSDSYAAAERERGWREALRDAGRTVPDVARGDWGAASGAVVATELARGGATAVFCANDQMALGVLGGLADLGLDVPRDVSVVGFDDVADAAHYRPPLTTVRQDFDGLAERAVARLVHAIETGETGGTEVVEPALVVRRSTGPVG